MQDVIEFEQIYEGGTFQGAEISIEDNTTGTPVPVVLTGANILMQCKKNNIVEAEYSTDNNKIIINNNKIIIAKHVPTLKAGVYEFDFNIIMPDGTIEPGIGQGRWEILDPKSKRTNE